MQAMCLSIFLDMAKLTKKRVKRYILYGIIIIIFLISTKLHISVAILLAGFYMANFMFEGKIWQKIWTNLLGVAIIYGVGSIDFIITERIMEVYPNSPWIENQILTDLRASLEIGVVWWIARQSSAIYKAKGQYKRITRRQSITIGLLVYTCIFMLYICNLIFAGEYDVLATNKTYMMFIATSMICIIALVVGVNEEMNKLYYKWSNECMSEQLNRQLKYYQKLEAFNKETRAIKHDMRNHMIIISNLAQRGDLLRLEQYIQQIETKAEQLDNIVHTGNTIVDAILNEKLQVATEKQITIDYQVNLIGNLGLEDMDLCVIFANSIDNAIEACERIEDISQRLIWIKANYDRGYLFYNIKNITKGRAKIVNEEIPTNKKDSINHGFGLNNIKDSVQKNNGKLNIINKENEFGLEIDIPINIAMTG